MKLSETLAQLEGHLQNLLNEVKELRVEANSLEKQNQYLRTLLYEQNDLGEGMENLLRIYREGFHVCPTHFAGARVEGEDCIFCLSFLEGQKVGD